jgi:hypothetical protein
LKRADIEAQKFAPCSRYEIEIVSGVAVKSKRWWSNLAEVSEIPGETGEGS